MCYLLSLKSETKGGLNFKENVSHNIHHGCHHHKKSQVKLKVLMVRESLGKCLFLSKSLKIIIIITNFWWSLNFLHQEANLEVEGGESLMKRGRESTHDRKLELNCKKSKRVFA